MGGRCVDVRRLKMTCNIIIIFNMINFFNRVSDDVW
jgi:hypothetical protein